MGETITESNYMDKDKMRKEIIILKLQLDRIDDLMIQMRDQIDSLQNQIMNIEEQEIEDAWRKICI